MINRYTLAGLLAVLGVVGVIALGAWAVGSAGDEANGAARNQDVAAQPSAVATAKPKATATAVPNAKLPAQKTKDLAQAAKLAGCTVREEPDEGNDHVERDVTADDYGTNPPTSGMHNPTWAPDGIYEPGNTPILGTLVHTLEHGRIDIQYRPGTAPATIANLAKLYEELDGGYHLLLFENTTAMPFAVAATAWDHLLGCPEFNDKVYDAIRAFTAEYVDKGPEVVP